MKKMILVLLLAVAATGAFAQFNKGRMLVGGAVGFQTYTEKTKSGSTTTTEGRSTSISLTPQFGYFVIDNLAVGAGLDVSLSKFKPDSDNDFESSSSSFAFQPFVRYYIKPGIFFQGAVGFGSGSDKQSYQGNSDKDKFGLFNWALSGGYALFLNDYVAVEPMVGFGMSTTKYKEDTDQAEYKAINSGLFLRVAFQIYLGDRED